MRACATSAAMPGGIPAVDPQLGAGGDHVDLGGGRCHRRRGGDAQHRLHQRRELRRLRAQPLDRHLRLLAGMQQPQTGEQRLGRGREIDGELRVAQPLQGWE